MKRKVYPTDLTDKQWVILGPLIPVAKTGGLLRRVNLREMLRRQTGRESTPSAAVVDSQLV